MSSPNLCTYATAVNDGGSLQIFSTSGNNLAHLPLAAASSSSTTSALPVTSLGLNCDGRKQSSTLVTSTAEDEEDRRPLANEIKSSSPELSTEERSGDDGSEFGDTGRRPAASGLLCCHILDGKELLGICRGNV